MNFFLFLKNARAAPKILQKRVKIGLNQGDFGDVGQKRGYNVSILGELVPQAELFPGGGGIFEFYLLVHKKQLKRMNVLIQ